MQGFVQQRAGEARRHRLLKDGPYSASAIPKQIGPPVIFVSGANVNNGFGSAMCASSPVVV